MTATITTAARRIVRTVNAAPRAYDRFYFAADGTEVSRLAGPAAFGPARYAIAVGRGITQAEAQTQLDAYAATLAANPAAGRIEIDFAIDLAVEMAR